MSDSRIDEKEFLIKFYDSLHDYVDASYENTIINFTDSKYNSFYENDFIPYAIIIAKSVFQNIHIFMTYSKREVMIHPAFTCFRSAIEGVRLLVSLTQDEVFRNQYLQNDNINFDEQPDYEFMQKRVTRQLRENEKIIRNQDYIPQSSILWNSSFIDGSPISRLHSELSKWSHMLNSNLLSAVFADGKISLKIYDETNLSLNSFIRKYMEGVYVLISELNTHMQSTSDFLDSSEIMLEIYSEYIDRYYKNKGE